MKIDKLFIKKRYIKISIKNGHKYNNDKLLSDR